MATRRASVSGVVVRPSGRLSSPLLATGLISHRAADARLIGRYIIMSTQRDWVMPQRQSCFGEQMRQFPDRDGEDCESDGVSQGLSEETATSWRRLSFYAPLVRIAVWRSKPYLTAGRRALSRTVPVTHRDVILSARPLSQSRRARMA